MSVGKLIVNKLSNIQDSTSNVPLYHTVIPQGKTFPAIVYNIVTGTADYVKGGTNKGDEIRVQIDIYHQLDTEANIVFTNVRTQLEGYQGIFENTRYNYTTLDNYQEGINEVFDHYRITADFIFRPTI